jgi:hypothetical protein
MSIGRGAKAAPSPLDQSIILWTSHRVTEVYFLSYIKETVISGQVIEVTKKYSSRYGKKGIPRSKNRNPTPDDVKIQNEKNAVKKLRRLINTNFGFNDIHLVLTYRILERPDPQTARKRLQKFLRNLRKLYRDSGQELKYICVTEYKGHAIHHHLVINSFDMRLITPLWPYGRARPTYLDNTGQYGKLAEYLIKETRKTYREKDAVFRKRWNQSRNLKQPYIKITVVKRDSWSKHPKPVKGYIIQKDSIICGVSAVTGYPFQFYSMIKLPDFGCRKRHKASRKKE